MQRGVMDKLPDADIRVYVVWVPMLRGAARHVPGATRELPDPRSLHYWDGDGQLVKGYRQTLELSEDAWDIFLLYGPEVRWDGDLPPEPEYWMHQLGSPSRPRVDAPYLDPATFLDRTRQRLARAN